VRHRRVAGRRLRASPAGAAGPRRRGVAARSGAAQGGGLMDVAAVMQEVADRLDTIAGLRVHGSPPWTITPPAAIVSYPESLEYSRSARGMDRISLPVVVLFGR